jgi:hypothetical protein
MKAKILIALAGVLLASPAYAGVTVLHFEKGGVIDDHRVRWRALAESGDAVQVRGRCQSACTLITGYIPRDRICFDEHAELAFHMPYNRDTLVTSPDAARSMFEQYPKEIQGWIDERGGVERLPRMGYWVLPAAELWDMGFRKCDLPVVTDAPVPRPRPTPATPAPAPVEHVAAAPQYRARPCPVASLLTLGVLCF